MYPNITDIHTDTSDDSINKALLQLVSDLPADSKRKLLFLLYGSHGSSIIPTLELITAYLQTPLTLRLNQAHDIIVNYELAAAKDKLTHPERVLPDIPRLKDAYYAAKDSVLEFNKAYAMQQLLK